MARQKKSKIASVITWLVLLLLLIGAIGAIVRLSGIGKDDITDMIKPTFRVEYDEKSYTVDNQNSVVLLKGNEAEFAVKNGNKFSVRVLPNVTEETDFTYTVNGKTYLYSGEKDLTEAFGIKIFENTFVIDMSRDYSLENVLSKVWGGETVTVGEHGSFPYYKLVVTSSDGKTVEMVLQFDVSKVVLTPDIIVF